MLAGGALTSSQDNDVICPMFLPSCIHMLAKLRASSNPDFQAGVTYMPKAKQKA
jgi:hypothetical protein